MPHPPERKSPSVIDPPIEANSDSKTTNSEQAKEAASACRIPISAGKTSLVDSETVKDHLSIYVSDRLSSNSNEGQPKARCPRLISAFDERIEKQTSSSSGTSSSAGLSRYYSRRPGSKQNQARDTEEFSFLLDQACTTYAE